MFKGSLTALVTPFNKGTVDFDAFKRLINWQIDQGVTGVIPCGTTGESATLTVIEQLGVIDFCVKTVDKRVKVLAGTGANDTQEAIHMTLEAQKLGIDGALLVTPYYNKPSQEGLYQHYKAVHDATNVPMVLYNVPGRTGVNMSVETIGRLSKLPRIVGIKDATPDLMRPLRLRQATHKDFNILSGEDALIVAFLAHGGDGCISVTGNVAPKLCADLHKAWKQKDLKTVEEITYKLMDLHEAMFVETNPCPAKYGTSLLGFGDGSVRLPLWEISDKSKETVRLAMVSAGVLRA